MVLDDSGGESLGDDLLLSLNQRRTWLLNCNDTLSHRHHEGNQSFFLHHQGLRPGRMRTMNEVVRLGGHNSVPHVLDMRTCLLQNTIEKAMDVWILLNQWDGNEDCTWRKFEQRMNP